MAVWTENDHGLNIGTDDRPSRIMAAFCDQGWSTPQVVVAETAVVPIRVVENLGPLDALKRSVELLKETWSEQIAGNLGMGLVFGVLLVAAIVVGGAGIAAAIAAGSTVLTILVIALAVVALLFLSLLSSALSGIYMATVYRHAADGEVGANLPAALVENTFRAR